MLYVDRADLKPALASLSWMHAIFIPPAKAGRHVARILNEHASANQNLGRQHHCWQSDSYGTANQHGFDLFTHGHLASPDDDVPTYSGSDTYTVVVSAGGTEDLDQRRRFCGLCW